MHALNGSGGLPHLDEVVPIEVLPLPQFPGGGRGSSHPFPHPFPGLQLPQDSPPHCFGSPDGCILDSDECQALEAEVEQHEALRRQIEQQQLTDIAFEDLHFLDELFPQPPQASSVPATVAACISLCRRVMLSLA